MSDIPFSVEVHTVYQEKTLSAFRKVIEDKQLYYAPKVKLCQELCEVRAVDGKLYGLKRLTQREQTYLLYRYGFTDGEEHPLIGAAIYFHLTKGRAQKTEEQAMDNLWLELPWWFL